MKVSYTRGPCSRGRRIRSRAWRQRRRPWWLGGVAAGFLGLLFGCAGQGIDPAEMDRVVAAVAPETVYRGIELPNGMRVMLISDPGAERSAAALAVEAGSLSDPPDAPGMAHFLEHMLFLGTEKYPEPDGYQQFVNQHAGFTNAYTADDHTDFFFQISDEAFPEALDRFAQFFVSPLFSPEYVAREMHAVDSEHSKNIENDEWRIDQIIRDNLDRNHPIHRFETGDLDTLRGVTRADLVAFYRGHYSANLMTLAVLADRTLDDMETLVRARFAQVENRDLEAPRFGETILEPEPALRLVTVDPVADERSLTLVFPLPPTFDLYESKPLDLVSFVLGHEGPGSLLSALKAKGLATTLTAGPDYETADYSSLELEIGLTPEGLTRYEDVLETVFGAIAYFRSHDFPSYIYEENKTMADLNFHYEPKIEPGFRAAQMSALMQTIPLSALPGGAYLYSRFDPAAIDGFFNRLEPDNALVVLAARGLPADRSDPYYGASYGYEERSGETYRRLAHASPDPEIRWPQPNGFVPRVSGLRRPDGPLQWVYASQLRLERSDHAPGLATDMAERENARFAGLRQFLTEMEPLVPASKRDSVLPELLDDALPIPMRLMDDDHGKVWFVADWRFRQPRAAMILTFRTPDAYGSPRQAALAGLYVLSWSEALDETGYAAREAGLDYELAATRLGIQLTLDGYSPRMTELLGLLTSRLREVGITPETFDSILDRYRRSLQNQRLAEPYEQAGGDRDLLLVDPTWPSELLEAELDDVTLDELQAYASQLYDRAYLEGAVAGNLDPMVVREALDDALGKVGSAALPKPERPDETIRPLKAGADYIYKEHLDVNNSLVEVDYLVGKASPTRRAATLVAGRALGESFFFHMRTEQQLGYIASAGAAQMKNTLWLRSLIQSGAYSADDLLSHTDAYFPVFVDEFAEMPPDQFERYRTAVVDTMLERARDIDQVAGHLQWIAFENDEKWDYLSKDIRAAESLTKEHMNHFLNRTLLDPKRSRAMILLIGKSQAPSISSR